MVKEFSNKKIDNEVKTRNARIWLDNEGIVHAVYTPGTEESLEDAENNLNAVGKVYQNKKRPIFITGPHKSMSRDARIYYVKHSPKYAVAVAVIIKSSFTKVLSTFLISLNKTINKGEFPVRFFAEEKKALDWLRDFTE
ncbi:MAG: hypothetical protein OEV78_06950 [Spirochaetia bacterium]|nr:hypothetical protein [Spirochaetia bacterium]